MLTAVGIGILRELLISTGWPPARFFASMLRWIVLPAVIVAAIALYRRSRRKWGPPTTDRPQEEPIIRRIFRLLGLGLPVLLLLMWGWSHLERLDLPGWNSFHYPRARGGEVLVRPRFDRGVLQVRYCRVIPGAPDRFVLRERWGFRYRSGTDHRYKAGTFIDTFTDVPIWFLVLLTTPLAAWCLVRELRVRRHRHRILHGLCLSCGYDLTGNVSGICPECGTPIAGSDPQVRT
jgi:hypothetical protein